MRTRTVGAITLRPKGNSQGVFYLLSLTTGHCNQQGKRGHYACARAYRHARTLKNPEALGPEIEEGAVNQRPLQALFPLPWGGAGSAAGPGAILLQLQNP